MNEEYDEDLDTVICGICDSPYHTTAMHSREHDATTAFTRYAPPKAAETVSDKINQPIPSKDTQKPDDVATDVVKRLDKLAAQAVTMATELIELRKVINAQNGQ